MRHQLHKFLRIKNIIHSKQTYYGDSYFFEVWIYKALEINFDFQNPMAAFQPFCTSPSSLN